MNKRAVRVESSLTLNLLDLLMKWSHQKVPLFGYQGVFAPSWRLYIWPKPNSLTCHEIAVQRKGLQCTAASSQIFRKEGTIMTRMNISRLSRKSFTGLILLVITLFLLSVMHAWADDYDGPEAGGSLIGAVRLIPESSYVSVPQLLEKYIKEEDESAWAAIKEKINYTYSKLGYAVWPVLRKNDLQSKVLAEIKAGKKLFFKPNLVNPQVLSLSGDGSQGLNSGVVACTDWAFIAALMRFFHDELGIRYYQMALGDAGTMMPAYSHLLKCTPEAIIEGCGFPLPDGKVFHAGWCMRWIREYLAETTEPLDAKDDPMNGYKDSLGGSYVTPGAATEQGKLMVYDLNNAEWFDRGRRVDVPDGGDNYREGIVLHKAIVGDPEDTKNYPGSVLVNAPILKVHGLTPLTNAIKNFGIGAPPMCAGQDSSAKTTDWLYSYPPDSPPGLKGGVQDGQGDIRGEGKVSTMRDIT